MNLLILSLCYMLFSSKAHVASLGLVSLLVLSGCGSNSQSPATPYQSQNNQAQQTAQADASQAASTDKTDASKPVPMSPGDNGGGTSGWLTYTNKPFNFSIDYPSTFALKKTGLDGLVATVATIEYPESYTKGTNLGYAKVNLKASEDAGTGKCLISEVTGKKLTETIVNNGTTFYKDSEKDGAAGHVGETLAYHTVHNGICYIVNLEEYYTNMGVYADGKGGYMPNAPKEFEPVKISSIFDQMFTKFVFTK